VQAPTTTPVAPATSLLDIIRLRPGWPLVLLFVGYPLWWVLGLTEPATIVATIAMASALVKLRPIRVPPGFALWLLFLIWVAVGFTVVMVDAPGAVAGGSSTRYLTWGFRLFWYCKATVAFLYIYNMRGRLTIMWYCRILSWMFVTIVIGGLLGVVAPTFQFTSLAELILPHSVSSSQFVHTKIHPVAAELHVLFGHLLGRTSAPFPYANVWGINFACYLPFFIIAWFGKDAGWRRAAAPFVLAIAIVPVIFSLNRGLWSALLVAATFVALHSAMAGRLRQMAALIVAGGVVALVVTFSPLHQTINDRLNGEGPKSNVGRNNLASLSTSSMLSTSPVVGFGTTRNVQGSFTSIAGGSTTDCPRCSPPALGTQGQFSLVTFTQGAGGAIFYFGFLVYHFLRNLMRRTALAIAGLSILTMHFVTSFIYGADNLAIFAILGAIALMTRERIDEQGRRSGRTAPYGPNESTLHGYGLVLREHVKVITACTLVGLLLAGLAIRREGKTYVATASEIIPIDPPFPHSSQRPTTLDNIAQFGKTAATERAMQDAVGDLERVSIDNLRVTATANSRILHLTYKASSANAARLAAAAAGQSVIGARAARLVERRTTTLNELKAQRRSLDRALQLIITAGRVNPETRRLLGFTYYEALIRDIQANNDIALTNRLKLDAGHPIAPIKLHTVLGTWHVLIASGFALGLLLGIAVATALNALTPRIGRKSDAIAARGLPVIADGRPDTLNIDMLVLVEQPIAAVGVGWRHHTLDVVDQIETKITHEDRHRTRQRVLLVTARGERLGAVMHARDSLTRSGAEVAGLVVVDSPDRRKQLVRS
jgi:hypothetical protein